MRELATLPTHSAEAQARGTGCKQGGDPATTLQRHWPRLMMHQRACKQALTVDQQGGVPAIVDQQVGP